MRHHQLRGLRRPPRRRAGEVVHRARGHGRRRPGRHRRGPRTRRRAGPGAGGLRDLPRPPVRLLHAQDAHDHPRAPRPRPRPVSGDDPGSHLRTDLPLHRLREHRALRPLGRPEAAGRPAHRAEGGGVPVTSLDDARIPGVQDLSAQIHAAPETPHGYGAMKRKEDARFVRGRGQYVDDVVLPGMLYGAVLRSPLAHARIESVDTSAAEAHPKVHAVITGETLAGLGLAWMPTLSQDTQAVLATDKVRFQGQEVAFVVADDKYAARDALDLIDVQYEPLDPVIDAKTALDPGTAVIRDDQEGRTDNHIFDWSSGDAARTDAVFAEAEAAEDQRVISADVLYPRVHPAPLETCGAIADMDPVTGKLTLWTTTQAPHAHRTLYALVAGLPEHKIRVVSPDIGGGFGNKVGIYPGYVCAVVGSIVTGRPVKWMEDRSENLMSTSFARDYHMRGEVAVTTEGRIRAVRVDVLADHGAFNATAQPT